MPQLFPRASNNFFRIGIVTAILLAGGTIATIIAMDRSRYVTDVGVAKEQPVQFSHQHHYSHLGIQCAYCHHNAEVAAYAGIPPTHTCMSCHSQIWVNSPMLEPVRASYASGQSLEWNKIHDLPDYVYFNHSIHVKKGFGCSTCHGRVDQMQLAYKVNSLQMEWCLNCHRQPEKYIRPRDMIYQMDWEPPANQAELGAKLVKEYNVRNLLDCYTCHR